MKAKMIRQGVITPNFMAQADGTQGAENQGIQRQPTGIQRKMTMTGMRFAAGMNKAGGADFASSKGFADAFMGDPSLRKLKEDIGLKETQNVQLADEIKRLKMMLTGTAGGNEIVDGLKKELDIKGDQMEERDNEITDLIEAKREIEDAKIRLEKQIEEMEAK